MVTQWKQWPPGAKSAVFTLRHATSTGAIDRAFRALVVLVRDETCRGSVEVTARKTGRPDPAGPSSTYVLTHEQRSGCGALG